MHKIIVLLLAMFVVFINQAEAAVQFDLPEYAPGGQYSTGALGEVLVSDPTSEGIEARFKYGIYDWMNIQGVMGIGSDYRQFRAGAQGTIRVFRESGYLPSVSFQFSPYYIERGDGPTLTDEEGNEFVDTNGKIQINAGVFVHRYFGLAGFPVNTYLSVPLAIELIDGRYKTGYQAILGSVFTLRHNKNYFVTGEFGLGLANMETYVAIGGGRRFGGTGHVPNFGGGVNSPSRFSNVHPGRRYQQNNPQLNNNEPQVMHANQGGQPGNQAAGQPQQIEQNVRLQAAAPVRNGNGNMNNNGNFRPNNQQRANVRANRQQQQQQQQQNRGMQPPRRQAPSRSQGDAPAIPVKLLGSSNSAGDGKVYKTIE